MIGIVFFEEQIMKGLGNNQIDYLHMTLYCISGLKKP